MEVDEKSPAKNDTNCDILHSGFRYADVIGDGAYGTVYKARHIITGNWVALKKIRISITEDGIPQTAMREITTLRHLSSYYNHPHVVKLLDIFQGSASLCNSMPLYLVFEHLDYNLAQYVTKYPNLTSNDITILTRQLLKGVDFLHSHRIVHRDLKPQNILISRAGWVKIADFGLSKIYDNEMKLTSLVQTLWYRAPEVILGQTYGVSIDVWAFGCILAEMYLKRPLFQGDSEAKQFALIAKAMGINLKEWPLNATWLTAKFPAWCGKDVKTIVEGISVEGADLLAKLLTLNQDKRITARQALLHEYFQEV